MYRAMTCCKVILIILFVSVDITVCDDTYSRYYRNPSTDVLNQGIEHSLQQIAHRNRISKVAEDAEVTKDKVNITVYYETLCPASIDFIVSQLKPAVEMLSPHLNIHLIPYGHATTRDVVGGYMFRCQHGQAECMGNMLHACTLYAVENRTEAILFNACLMQYHTFRGEQIVDYIRVLNWCGHKQRVLIHRIWDCMSTNRGSVLLKGYGEETHAEKPEYVPYLVLDGINNEQANEDLFSTVCQMLKPTPVECNAT